MPALTRNRTGKLVPTQIACAVCLGVSTVRATANATMVTERTLRRWRQLPDFAAIMALAAQHEKWDLETIAAVSKKTQKILLLIDEDARAQRAKELLALLQAAASGKAKAATSAA